MSQKRQLTPKRTRRSYSEEFKIEAVKLVTDQKYKVAEAVFLPITLKASPVEIELPNGGIVRLPLGVGQAVLVEVIRAAGALRPWKAPKS